MEYSILKILDIFFFLSLFINAALFLPQIIQLTKVRNSRGVSLITFLGFNIIQFLTILHGYIRHDYLLMVGYIASFIMCGIVTILTIKYRRVS